MVSNKGSILLMFLLSLLLASKPILPDFSLVIPPYPVCVLTIPMLAVFLWSMTTGIQTHKLHQKILETCQLFKSLVLKVIWEIEQCDWFHLWESYYPLLAFQKEYSCRLFQWIVENIINVVYSGTPPKGHFWNEDTPLIRTHFSGPMVSVLERFHCRWS